MPTVDLLHNPFSRRDGAPQHASVNTSSPSAGSPPFAAAKPPAPVARYDAVAKLLHWCIAAALLAQAAVGYRMQDIPKLPAGPRAFWFNMHKSVGITLGVLILLRLAWRLAHRPPAWPTRMPAWQAKAATALHGAMYAAMLLMPLSGLVGSFASGRPILFFGMPVVGMGTEMPALKNACSAIHEALSWVLAAMVVAHVAAALRHLLQGDGVFRRMWPGRG